MEEARGEKFKKKESNPQLKQIRTFQGDVASALAQQKESLVSIQQKEESKRRESGISNANGEDNAKKRKDFLFLFFGSIVFIVLGSAGAWYGYQEFLRRSAPPTIAVPESRFISAGSSRELDVSSTNREGFARMFNEVIAEVPEGELRHVIVRKGTVNGASIPSITEFMLLIESRAPGSLIRSFDKLFMTGAVGSSPFLIIKLVSFENAFAGMLNWEKDMARDLSPIFSNSNLLKVIDSPNVFRDVIVRNKDVRVLNLEEGTSTTPVLLYSFFDNNMIIITNTIEALQTLIDRLTREKLAQ